MKYAVIRFCLALVGGVLPMWGQAGMLEAGDKENPRVLASIKPLALITEALVEGTNVDVEVLLPPTSSPHSYALKISDARRLQEANLVIWLGAEAEPYINPERVKKHLALLQHFQKPQLIGAEYSHGDYHHNVDPHVWLDPVLGLEIARLLAEQLAQQFPESRAIFEDNLNQFRNQVNAADQEMNRLLQKHRHKGFLVYHNAYAYFVKHYELKQLGVVQEQIGAGGMSVKHLSELHKAAKAGEAICLFREPQFAQAAMPELGNEYVVKEGILDPLGIKAERYEELLETLVNQMVECFERR